MWQTCINVIFYCLVWILLTPFKNFTQVSALRFLHLLQEASFSVLHSCSLTSEGKVLKILSSTIRPLFFSNLHSPSSTGRHSSLLPLSSSCVRLVSSPNREGRDCRQLFPRFSVRNFLHWNNSGGSTSIYKENERIKENKVDWKYNHITIISVIYKNVLLEFQQKTSSTFPSFLHQLYHYYNPISIKVGTFSKMQRISD